MQLAELYYTGTFRLQILRVVHPLTGRPQLKHTNYSRTEVSYCASLYQAIRTGEVRAQHVSYTLALKHRK